MFNQDFMTGGDQKQINASAKINKTNIRRASKMLVELSIGIIGIIAVMLAQIASRHAEKEVNLQTTDNGYIVYQLTDDFANKVASLTEVSPTVTQVNWLNILF